MNRKGYVPTKGDLDWTRDLLGRLNDGGVWCYKDLPIMVVKVNANRVRLVVGDDILPGAFPILKSNVERLKTVLTLLHITIEGTPQGEGL